MPVDWWKSGLATMDITSALDMMTWLQNSRKASILCDCRCGYAIWPFALMWKQKMFGGELCLPKVAQNVLKNGSDKEEEIIKLVEMLPAKDMDEILEAAETWEQELGAVKSG